MNRSAEQPYRTPHNHLHTFPGIPAVVRVATIMLAAAVLLSGSLFPVTGAWAQPHPRVRNEWRETSTTAHPAFLSLTPEGHLLVARNGYLGPSVVEIDTGGRTVWEYAPVQATAATRLANGRTLICDSGAPGPPRSPGVLEVDHQGKIVWRHMLKDRAAAPQSAQRLADGHTLIALPDRVLEVDDRGRVTWSSKALFLRAAQAQRLANGRTLVVDRGLGRGGKVVELDSKGRPVWQYPGSTGQGALLDPIAVRREGSVTQIVDLGASRILFVDPDGELVDVISWQDVRTALPIGNQWWAACASGGSLWLSASYTNGRSTILELDDRSVRVYLNRKLMLLDFPAVIEQQQVLVPLREVVTALGGTLSWDPAAKQAKVQAGTTALTYTVGQAEFLRDDRTEPLPVAPRLAGGSILAPYAALVEALGATAGWDETKPALYLTKPVSR